MTLDPRLRDALSRIDKDALIEQLLTGKIDEAIGKAVGMQIKSETAVVDPPPAEVPPAQPEQAQAQQTAEPTAELTDAEADRIADKVWSRLAAKYDAKAAEQQTAATKAAEPLLSEVASVKLDMSEVKAMLKAALGEQSAGQVYRASQSLDTVRIDPATGQPITKAQTPQPTTVSTMSDFVLGAQPGSN